MNEGEDSTATFSSCADGSGLPAFSLIYGLKELLPTKMGVFVATAPNEALAVDAWIDVLKDIEEADRTAFQSDAAPPAHRQLWHFSSYCVAACVAERLAEHLVRALHNVLRVPGEPSIPASAGFSDVRKWRDKVFAHPAVTAPRKDDTDMLQLLSLSAAYMFGFDGEERIIMGGSRFSTEEDDPVGRDELTGSDERRAKLTRLTLPQMAKLTRERLLTLRDAVAKLASAHEPNDARSVMAAHEPSVDSDSVVVDPFDI